MTTRRQITPRREGEPAEKPCSGELHNGELRPIEEFRLNPPRHDGSQSRRHNCYLCERTYQKSYTPSPRAAIEPADPASPPRRQPRGDLIVPCQPGEGATKRCNGPLCNGRHLPIDRFGTTSSVKRNGNLGRRSRCFDCDRAYGRTYLRSRAQESLHGPIEPVRVAGPRICLAWRSRHWLVMFDSAGGRHVEPAARARLQQLRDAGVLAEDLEIGGRI